MIQQIYDILREKKLRAAFVESCTGGMCAARMVSLENASDVFLGSMVTYDTSIKSDWLNMNDEDQLVLDAGTETQDCAAVLVNRLRNKFDSNTACMSVVGHLSGDDRFIYVGCSKEGYGTIISSKITLVNFNRISCQEEATNKAFNFFLNFLEYLDNV